MNIESGPAKVTTIPTTQLELSISCQNLKNMDTFSKSDPQCTVYMRTPSDKEWRELGKTEIIWDNLNPHFVKKFVVNYNFETVQRIKFELWDIDTVSNDFLGVHETTLAQIVAYQGREYTGDIKDDKGKNAGKIVLVAEEVSNCKRSVLVKFRGFDIGGTSFFTKPQAFLTIWRSIEDGSFTLVHQTEKHASSHKPDWKKIFLSARVLCNGDFDRNIKIDCMRYKMSGDHQLIGSFHTTLNDLMARAIDPSRKKLILSHPNTKNPGYLELVSLEVEEEISFFDYIKGGTQLHFAVAIDFTASNGDPRYPESLHYIGPGKQNPYEMALFAVGEILRPYNALNIYPGYGFGAKLAPNETVSHQFPLNGNPAHPYCQGIEELTMHYRQTVHRVIFYGPTNFAPVIRNISSIAKQYSDGKSYFVLLIITDGIICDMPQTKQAIVDASALPLSIIIVGVGNDEFTAMDELDSDEALLEANGKTALRDIVQFVPLRKYVNSDGVWLHSMADLSQDVLYELPDQLVSYMRYKGIKPVNRNS